MQQGWSERINYKYIALVMGLANLMWIFLTVWLFFGFAFVLVLAAVLNHLITRLDITLSRRQGFERFGVPPQI